MARGTKDANPGGERGTAQLVIGHLLTLAFLQAILQYGKDKSCMIAVSNNMLKGYVDDVEEYYGISGLFGSAPIALRKTNVRVLEVLKSDGIAPGMLIPAPITQNQCSCSNSI